MPRSSQLTLGGRTVWIVRADDIEAWDEDVAHRVLRASAEEWPARHALTRLATDTGGPDDDLERALAHLARAIERGQILVVRVEDELGAFVPDAGSDDWLPADTPSLSDLLLPAEPGSAPRARPSSDPDAPPSADPSAPAVDDATEHFVAFVVTDTDGAPLRGTWRCTLGADDEDGSLGADVVRFDRLAAATSVTLSFRPQGYLGASRHAFAPTDEGSRLARAEHVFDMADELGPLALSLDRTSAIVVRVPKATVFTLPAYELDLEVFRPGFLWFDEADAHGVSGLGCIAQMLAYARLHPERHLLIVGHTDTSGSKSHNRGVAERRASHLAALLRADVDAWIASCAADGTTADLAAHLQWAARRFGWPCDAGIVDHETQALRDAIATWREHAAIVTGIHIERSSPPSSDDWRLAYALFDLALAEELDLDLGTLGQLRAGLHWCDPPIVGAGELWPRALVGKNGVASAVNRRTEVLFATVDRIPSGAGEPAGTSIYGDDAWLWLDYVDPEPRAVLPLALVSSDGHPVHDTPFKLKSEGGRVRFGRLAADVQTYVDDVAAGPFRVYWTDPDDVTVKVWVARCEVALQNRDVPMLERIFDRAPALVQAVSQAWSLRFGDGAADGLARAARALVADTDDELLVDYLLAEAGLPDRVRYEPSALAEVRR